MSVRRWGAILGLATLAGCAGVAAGGKAPQVGDRAPEFRLTASDGKGYALSQLRGKVVVIA